MKFLDTRKRVYSVYERYEEDMRALQKKSEAANDKLSPSDLWSAGGKIAEVVRRDPPGADEGPRRARR